MERKKAEPISLLLSQFLRMKGMETPLYEHRLIASWAEVVPSKYLSYTKDLFIKNQCLYVKVTSAVAKNELFLHRKELVAMLNDKVGYHTITDICFT